MKRIDRKVVIAGLVRDCEKSLPNIISIIDRLRLNFVKSEVVIVENDSKDRSKEILFDWEKRTKGVKIICHDLGTLTIPVEKIDGVDPLVSFHRIEKMVIYRNIYLRFVKEVPYDIDNLIVIDMDIASFSVDSVVDAVMKCRDKCGGIFANGVTVKKICNLLTSRIFYDVFAVYEFPMKETFAFTEDELTKTLKSVTSKLRRDKYHKVISAFGGIGVYNYRAISALEYTTVANSANLREAICEHIPLNCSLVNLGYENYISSDMEVIYGEHSFGAILKFFLPKYVFRRLLNFVRIVNC